MKKTPHLKLVLLIYSLVLSVGVFALVCPEGETSGYAVFGRAIHFELTAQASCDNYLLWQQNGGVYNDTSTTTYSISPVSDNTYCSLSKTTISTGEVRFVASYELNEVCGIPPQTFTCDGTITGKKITSTEPPVSSYCDTSSQCLVQRTTKAISLGVGDFIYTYTGTDQSCTSSTSLANTEVLDVSEKCVNSIYDEICYSLADTTLDCGTVNGSWTCFDNVPLGECGYVSGSLSFVCNSPPPAEAPDNAPADGVADQPTSVLNIQSDDGTTFTNTPYQIYNTVNNPHTISTTTTTINSDGTTSTTDVAGITSRLDKLDNSLNETDFPEVGVPSSIQSIDDAYANIDAQIRSDAATGARPMGDPYETTLTIPSGGPCPESKTDFDGHNYNFTSLCTDYQNNVVPALDYIIYLIMSVGLFFLFIDTTTKTT